VLKREPGRAWTLLVASVGGLLTETAFPGRSWWPAAMIGIAALALALRRDSARWNALVGSVWGLAFFLPHLYWANASVGALPWIALSLLEAAFVGAFAAGWTWSRRAPFLRNRPIAGAAVFAAAWVLIEQARSAWPFGGFPWGRLAFSQTDAPLVALAAIGGAPLVSAAVAAAGALLAQTVVAARAARGPLTMRELLDTATRGARTREAATALAGAAVIVCAGLLVPLPVAGESPNGDDTAEAAVLRIAAVQGNVAKPGLDAFEHRLEVLRNHVAGTLAVRDAVGPGGVDVVLWPENAADVDPRVDSRGRALVVQAVTAVDTPILVGTLSYDDLGRYNDSVLWTPDDGPVATYTKQHPAPFAEYIPMRDFARLFTDKVDLVRTDMLPGTEVGIVPLDVARLGRTVPLADAICFEVAYDGLLREAALAGGELIVVQTNNASFGWTQESVQQLAMTRLRAVEHGRTAVQVSTVGVSGVIAPDGTVLQRTELFTAAQMIDTVPLRTTLTVSDRLGTWPLWAAAAGAVVVLAAGLRTTVDRRSTPGRTRAATGARR
jgi:apolipoprotein N-acyltransferase